ncbi:MAG: hypothetical protein M0T85_01745 [Dehalococcoidales bacterium]|nr:hypothetical protein [Dehalococcoidales bacterium]
MEQITPDELAYHIDVIEDMKAARTVMASWSAFLARKYRLAPLDKVDESGRILRAVDTETES